MPEQALEIMLAKHMCRVYPICSRHIHYLGVVGKSINLITVEMVTPWGYVSNRQGVKYLPSGPFSGLYLLVSASIPATS
jgi:hypothetical protein